MIHKNIPDYIKDAARAGTNCEVERLSSSSEGTVVTVLTIPGKTALKILSKEENKKSAIEKRIRAIGETGSLPVQKVADASLLNDDALRIEFEKRFGKPAEPIAPEASATEEKPKGRPGPKPKNPEALDESPSLLTDQNGN